MYIGKCSHQFVNPCDRLKDLGQEIKVLDDLIIRVSNGKVVIVYFMNYDLWRGYDQSTWQPLVSLHDMFDDFHWKSVRTKMLRPLVCLWISKSQRCFHFTRQCRIITSDSYDAITQPPHLTWWQQVCCWGNIVPNTTGAQISTLEPAYNDYSGPNHV